MTEADGNEYSRASHAQSYLAKADGLPHRAEGEAVLLELIPPTAHRILDLGSGDGRLLALVKQARPMAQGAALDFSPVMLDAARERFKGDPSIAVVAHDMIEPLPDLGRFDCVISSFAIHHLPDPRKQALYAEVFEILTSGGLFANLEHVASPTAALHEAFYKALGPPWLEDPSNRCTAVETQLAWLRAIGFEDVDCFWKWRELALLAGQRPG